MWNWVRDQKLRDKFSSLSRFEKFVLFAWAFLPFMWSKIGSNTLANAYIKFSSILQIFGITFESLYAALFLFAVILFVCRADVVKTAMASPKCDFGLFKTEKWIWLVTGALLLGGVYSLYLIKSHPEILGKMENLSQSAQIVDWICKSFKEEFTDRLIFYYIAISFFGRSGGFLLAMLFFALSHSFSHAYMLNMMFAGSFYLFLMLWSGSLSLPILVHLLSNGAIFFWFVLMA